MNFFFIFIFIIFLVIHSKIEQVNGSDFLDISNLDYEVMKSNNDFSIKFRMKREGKIKKLQCSDCEVIDTQTIKCNNSKTVHLTVHMEEKNKQYSTMLNISCHEKQNISHYESIENIDSISSDDEIEIVWKTINEESKYFIVYYMSDKNQQKFFTNGDNPFLSIKNLPEKTLYQICIASINKEWITSRYKCILSRTDFAKTGPVTNVTVSSNDKSIFLLWKKPEYEFDNPQGYIVNYETEDQCRTIIINMGNNRIPNKFQCSYPQIKYWQNLQTLILDKLSPKTTYNIDILPFIEDKLSKEYTLTVSTEKLDERRRKISALENFNYSIINIISENVILFKYEPDIIKISLVDKTKTINYRSLFCKKNENIHLNLSLTLNNIELKLPYKVSCQEIKKQNTILEMKAKSNKDKITITWTTTIPGDVDLIYFADKKINQVRITSQNNNNYSFEITNVAERTTYDICLTPITNYKEGASNGPFKCIYILSDFLSTGPIENMEILSVDNAIIMKWSPPAYEYDRPQGYILNYVNLLNKKCKSLIINQVNNNIVKEMSCNDRKSISVNLGWNYVLINDLPSNNMYRIEIIPYNNGRKSIKIIETIQTKNEDCFYDCLEENDSRLQNLSQNQNKCKQNNLKSFLWNVCDLPRCVLLSQVSECVKTAEIEATDSTAAISWRTPTYGNKVKGYITILQKNNICEQAHLQTCENCTMKFMKTLTDLYNLCKLKKSTASIIYESTFTDLDENELYVIYLIPILDEINSGAIKRFRFKTKFNETIRLSKLENGQTTEEYSTNLEWDKNETFKNVNDSEANSKKSENNHIPDSDYNKIFDSVNNENQPNKFNHNFPTDMKIEIEDNKENEYDIKQPPYNNPDLYENTDHENDMGQNSGINANGNSVNFQVDLQFNMDKDSQIANEYGFPNQNENNEIYDDKEIDKSSKNKSKIKKQVKKLVKKNKKLFKKNKNDKLKKHKYKANELEKKEYQKLKNKNIKKQKLKKYLKKDFKKLKKYFKKETRKKKPIITKKHWKQKLNKKGIQYLKFKKPFKMLNYNDYKKLITKLNKNKIYKKKLLMKPFNNNKNERYKFNIKKTIINFKHPQKVVIHNRQPKINIYRPPKINNRHLSKINNNRLPKINIYRPPKINNHRLPKINIYRPPKINNHRLPKINIYRPPKINNHRLPKINIYRPPKINNHKLPKINIYRPPKINNYRPPRINNYRPPRINNYRPPRINNYRPPRINNYRPPRINNYRPPRINNYRPPRINNFRQSNFPRRYNRS